jgi:hypothetical protein
MANSCYLIVLTKFRLPKDYAWQVGLAYAMANSFEASLPPYRLPRFCGYYFGRNAQPIGLCRDGCAELPLKEPIAYLSVHVWRATNGEFSIVSDAKAKNGRYLLVHDNWSGSCWLQPFDLGFRFLTAKDPVLPP